jgi:cytidylate kinase
MKGGMVMYFVTVSEMLGSGGENVARQVAEKLNYPFYAKEELFKVADEMGYLSDLSHLELKSPHLLEKYFSDKPKIYLDRFQSVIYEVAKRGNALFFGKGSQLLLHQFDCALHVLVTGSMEKRVARLMRGTKIKKALAEKIIQTSDHDKAGFVKYAFDEDWLNPRIYDIIINTDKLNIESAVGLVCSAAQSEEIKSCSAGTVATLGRLSLERKIESALLEAGVLSLRVFYDVEDLQTIRFYGVVQTEEEKEAVINAARSIKDIKDIIDDLTVRTPPNLPNMWVDPR